MTAYSQRGMTIQVFWPTTGLKRDEGAVVGWRVDNVVVVVAIVEEWMASDVTGRLGLHRLGRASSVVSPSIAASSNLEFIVARGRPVRTSPSARLVFFDPPDPVRLRYLTSSPTSKVNHTAHLDKQDGYGIGSAHCGSPAEVNRILQMLNQTRTAQRDIDRLSGSTGLREWHLGRISAAAVWLASALLVPVALFLRWLHAVSTVEIFGIRLDACSATLQQLALRSRQLLDGPAGFQLTLYHPSVPLEVRSGRYVRFWNTVWLILNDLVLGYCAGELLKLAIPLFARKTLALFQGHLVQEVIAALTWLDDWPVGLKLNTPLSRFFRITFTIIINSWSDLVTPLLVAHIRTCSKLVALTGYGGLTLLLAVLRDAIGLLTLHLRLCHTITLYLAKWQLASLGGLWNLFRGKKWNVLRQRTDSYAYDVDQLFLGTLLFTVSAFLFPTVLTYAALFALIRAGLWLLDQGLRLVTDALNAFPLFEVLLRLKEPSRLPDGIVFKLRQTRASPSGHALELQVGPAMRFKLKPERTKVTLVDTSSPKITRVATRSCKGAVRASRRNHAIHPASP